MSEPYSLPNCWPNISETWQKGSAEPHGKNRDSFISLAPTPGLWGAKNTKS